MKIKLTKDQMDYFRNNEELEIDGVNYEIHEDLGFVEHEHGRTWLLILKRESDGKLFSHNVEYVRYGHEDYGYEPFAQDGYIHEVEKREIVRTEWVAV